MDVLQESWVRPRKEVTSVLDYILQMREKMEQNTKLVKRHMQSTVTTGPQGRARSAKDSRYSYYFLLLKTNCWLNGKVLC